MHTAFFLGFRLSGRHISKRARSGGVTWANLPVSSGSFRIRGRSPTRGVLRGGILLTGVGQGAMHGKSRPLYRSGQDSVTYRFRPSRLADMASGRECDAAERLGPANRREMPCQ